MNNTIKALKRLVLSFIVPIIFLFAWTYFANRIDNGIILPHINKVLMNFRYATSNFIDLGSIPKNLFISFIRVSLGYLAGVL